jgi:hypothetical protein
LSSSASAAGATAGSPGSAFPHPTRPSGQQGYGGLNPSLSQWVDRSRAARYARKEARKAARLARKLGKVDYKMACYAHKVRRKAMKKAAKAARHAGVKIDLAGRLQPNEAPRRVPVNVTREAAAESYSDREIRPWWRNGATWAWILVAVLAARLVLGRGAFFGMTRFAVVLAIYAALAFAIYWLYKQFSSPPALPVNNDPNPRSGPADAVRVPVAVQTPSGGETAAVATAPPVTRNSAPPVQAAYRYVPPPRRVVYPPNTRRTIPLRQRVAELTGSMTFAAFVTAVMTAALALLGLLREPATIGMFGIVTLAGAWGILVPSKLTEGTGLDSGVRRLMFLACGVLVGAGAYFLDQALMINLWSNKSVEQVIANRPADSVFRTVGSYALVDGRQPTQVAYMLFFGGLFGLRRWWRHADAFRSKRFRVGTTLLTAAVGFLLPMIWAFPITCGVVWAAAISSVVQLSSVWVPAEDRQRLMKHNGSAASMTV